MLELSGEDIAILSATAATLGHPLLDPDMADLVQTYAQQLSGQYRQVDRTELISLIARLAGLLEPDLIAVEARRHEDAAERAEALARENREDLMRVEASRDQAVAAAEAARDRAERAAEARRAAEDALRREREEPH